MEKLNRSILKRTEEILMMDKKIKNNSFLSLFEKDIKNLIDVYFSSSDFALEVKLLKGDFGNLNIEIHAKNVKPKKVGINA